MTTINTITIPRARARAILVREALDREGRCYVQGRPRLLATAAETLTVWRRAAAAELLVRGLDPESTRVVWAISLLDVERLAVPAPEIRTGDLWPVTWLRYLSDNGELFEWSATAIRRAREDFGLDDAPLAVQTRKP